MVWYMYVYIYIYIYMSRKLDPEGSRFVSCRFVKWLYRQSTFLSPSLELPASKAKRDKGSRRSCPFDLRPFDRLPCKRVKESRQ